MVVKFIARYFVKPIYIFGGFGIAALLVSAICLMVMVYWRIVDGVSMIQTPMPVLASMTFLVGVVSILMGLLAEILVRIYFESQDRPAYNVRAISDATSDN